MSMARLLALMLSAQCASSEPGSDYEYGHVPRSPVPAGASGEWHEPEAQCDDGTSLAYSSFCDGEQDCDSDEHNCVLCADGQWSIPAKWQCDGADDCNAASDEMCFQCYTGTPQCIISELMCDGHKACADGSDEYCLQCDDGSALVHETRLCDGNSDCADGSDEDDDTCSDDSSTRPPPTATGGPGPRPTAKPKPVTVPPPANDTCGVSAPEHRTRLSIIGQSVKMGQKIVGGTTATPHSIPWQVQVVSRRGSTQWLCGGTLIAPKWVLTAAHCVDREGISVIVVLGAHGKNSGQSVKAKRHLLHPMYGGQRGYDIALVLLSRPAIYSAKVKPVCLPDASDSFQTNGRDVVVSGWGRLVEGGAAADYLQVVTLRTAQTLCESAYGHKLTTRDMCAAAPGIQLQGR